MKRIIFIILPIFVFLTSCERETKDFDGPSLVDRFGEFQLTETLSASRATVDFSSGQNVFFEAQFSKSIAWVVRITGKESGAVKLIEGFDRILTEENAVWNGTTTELPLFKAEECLVELIIPEEDSLTISLDVMVTGSRVYEGNLVTDFESDPGGSLFTGDFEFELSPNTGITDFITAGQGDKFFFFEGTDDVVANFFTGLIRIFPSINGETFFSLPTTDPENAYFNFFLYGDLTPNTIAVIQFFTDSNGDGEFTDGVDQSFQVEGDFPVNFEGWKFFSHTLAEIGMSEAQASEIVAIQVLLISNLNAQPSPPEPVRFGIDYLTFTQDQPLQL
jgi:hypothetical protein